MTDREVIELLERTGHLRRPFGAIRQNVPRCDESDYDALTLDSDTVVYSILSYQDFMMERLDPLCLKHHSRPALLDGHVGPATRELFELPRCGYPDYGEEVQPAIGKGSWAGCHGIGDFHAATIYVDETNMSAFLKPIFQKVWDRSVAAYTDIGLQFTRTDDEKSANIHMSFELGRRPYIGLAQVGRNQPCKGDQIWCKFLASYQPAKLLEYWTRLNMHEWAHLASLRHTRGGIMNPSITPGLASWKDDPSEPILKGLYGGVPIPDNRTEEYWVTQCFKSNRGRESCVPLVPPIRVDEEPWDA
ncbi:hypothetical protein LCGC14_0248870 [marine sediment metagenome]|uniref:Uncharacterized protein n=1 Tax=marine sediment metagenome TaxID=412755 RepID=A0A0F9U534_9ZZZZ